MIPPKHRFHAWEDPACGGCQVAAGLRTNPGHAGAGCADHEGHDAGPKAVFSNVTPADDRPMATFSRVVIDADDSCDGCGSSGNWGICIFPGPGGNRGLVLCTTCVHLGVGVVEDGTLVRHPSKHARGRPHGDIAWGSLLATFEGITKGEP